MGITWDERDKIAFAMVVLPDGRIICQRPAHPSFVKVWQATAYRDIPAHLSNTPEVAILTAETILWVMFKLELNSQYCTHLASHYVENMGKRLEIVMCKLPSRARIEVPNHIDIKFLTFEELVYGIGQDRGSFAPHTIHAVNLLAEIWRTQTWSTTKNPQN